MWTEAFITSRLVDYDDASSFDMEKLGDILKFHRPSEGLSLCVARTVSENTRQERAGGAWFPSCIGSGQNTAEWRPETRRGTKDATLGMTCLCRAAAKSETGKHFSLSRLATISKNPRQRSTE